MPRGRKKMQRNQNWEYLRSEDVKHKGLVASQNHEENLPDHQKDRARERDSTEMPVHKLKYLKDHARYGILPLPPSQAAHFHTHVH